MKGMRPFRKKGSRGKKALVRLAIFSIIVTALLLVFSTAAFATTINVPADQGTIQAAINAAASGDTINIAAGTYTENVMANKPVTLAGAGAGSTIIQPAVSQPTCPAATTLCGSATGASNVILVQANDVVIHDLTVDGDNPSLTSGIVVNGADLDARSGIVEDYYDAGVWNNLTVYNVTVQNIYLRGLYTSSGGTGVNFHDNTVTNVAGESGSIAIMSWQGTGVIANNTVSYANDAIAANHSAGIQFLNNTVTNSGSGVHTDNAGDGGGTADLIQGNSVSDCTTDGYGVWVFVSYIAPTVDNNTITNCSIGLSAWGGSFAPDPTVTAIFTNNTVNGPGSAPGSVGAYITTDTMSWGYTDVAVDFSGNVIKDNETGVMLTADQQTWNPDPYVPMTITADFSNNEISGNTVGLDKGTTGTYNATALNNWWGDASGPYNATSNPTGTGNSIVDGVPYDPWLGIAPISPTVTYVGPTGEVNVGNPLVTATAAAGASSGLDAYLGLAGQLDLANPWDVTIWTFPCTVDGGGNVSCPTDGLPEGAYTATVTVVDSNGQTGDATGNFNIVDIDPPVTTDDAPSGWQNTDVTVTLTCTDTVSGCDFTDWSADNSGGSGTGNTILVTNEGVTTITYYSTDNVGHVEAPNTTTVSIDKTNPVVVYTGPTGTVYTNVASITGTVTDASPSSGIDSVTGAAVLSLDGGATYPFSCTVSLSGDIDCPTPGLANGTYSAVISATDNAGNNGTDGGTFTYAAHGQPNLGVSVAKVYWATYADYQMGILSVDYTMTNHSTGLSAIGVSIVTVVNTNSVILLTTTPVTVGDIAAGASAGFTLEYSLPPGVTQFMTSIYASASDPTGTVYYYPGPYTGP